MGLQKIIISLSWQIYSETAPCVQSLFFHIRDIKYDSIKPFSFEIYKIVNYYSKLSKIINIHGIWIFIRPNISIFGGIFSNSPNIKKYLCPNPTCLRSSLTPVKCSISQVYQTTVDKLYQNSGDRNCHVQLAVDQAFWSLSLVFLVTNTPVWSK